jgi:probable addiction module antidote protein
MTEIAASANVSREVMYKSFRQGGNPTLSTLSQVARALGYKVTFQHTG